jgi:hypothetical protein
MKAYYGIIALILLVTSTVLLYIYIEKANQNNLLIKESEKIAAQRSDLYAQISSLKVDIINLEKTAYLKAFPSEVALQDWYRKNFVREPTTHSVAAIRLMNLARNDGYFIGIVVVEESKDYSGQSILKIPADIALTKDFHDEYYPINIAIVGDNQIYLIDPTYLFVDNSNIRRIADIAVKFRWSPQVSNPLWLD